MRAASFIGVAAGLVFAGLGSAETIRVTPEDDWFARLAGAGLQPGDELVLAKGVYSDPRRLEISHRGTAENPITIRGEEGAVFQRPDARQNSLNIAGSAHLVIRDLEITGGSSGIRIHTKGDLAASDITLENLHIHHTGGPAVTCNHENNIYRGMVFRNNHIHHTGGHGEAFYLGSNNAKDGRTTGAITGALIEGNYIHHLDSDQISQGDGIELKDGSWGNVVRRNVIHDTKYPAIIAYGTDGKEPNRIEQNLIWNSGDHGIQVAAEAVVSGNIISRTDADGIRSQKHQSAIPGNLEIINNTILESGARAVRIDSPHEGESTVAGNRHSGDMRLASGVIAKDNGPSATGAGKFDPAWVPAWDPPAEFLLRDLLGESGEDPKN